MTGSIAIGPHIFLRMSGYLTRHASRLKSVWFARKQKITQRLEFFRAPFFFVARVNDQNTGAIIEAVQKARQVFPKGPRALKIINSGKTIVRAETRFAQGHRHSLAKTPDHPGFHQRKPLLSQTPQRQMGVADVRTPLFRQAEDKPKEGFSHARRLMNVQVAVN